MRGPIPADVKRQSRGRSPGVCQAGSSDYGFFVEYRQVGLIGGILEQWEAVINLLVQDLSSTSSASFSGFIPFVIDTGSDVTIIPRRLVPPRAFPDHEAVRPYDVPVEGLTGGIVSGRTFRASLAIIPPATKYGGLGFNILTVVVVDSWHGKHATLGLDALRRVVMVSDREHVSFWPAPT